MSKYKIDKTKLYNYHDIFLPTKFISSFPTNIERVTVNYNYDPQELWSITLNDNGEYIKMIKEELVLRIARQLINQGFVEYSTINAPYNLQTLTATIRVIKEPNNFQVH